MHASVKSIILWRFLHIPKNSVNESSRATISPTSFNEEKSSICFPSGRRAWHNCFTNLSSIISNRLSIGGVAGNVSKNFPTLVEHSKPPICNLSRFAQHAKSAKVKFLIDHKMIVVRVGRWRRGRRTFCTDVDVQSSLPRS